MIEYPLGNPSILDVFLSHLVDSAIHGQVIVTSGDNQIDLTNFATGINPVMVEKGSTGGNAIATFNLPNWSADTRSCPVTTAIAFLSLLS